MAEMLSPGVFVTEIDASTIVPTVSNSVAVFSGDFVQGPVDTYTLITSVSDLLSFYGKPTNSNYNDFYQAYNFLQYGNKLLVSRAANVGGTATPISGCTYVAAGATPNVFEVSNVASLSIGDLITLDAVNTVYEIVSINTQAKTVTVDRDIDVTPTVGDEVNSWVQTTNGVVEAADVNTTSPVTVNAGASNQFVLNVASSAVTTDTDYVGTLVTINNASDFESKESSLIFANPLGSKLKFISRNPGAWATGLEIAIARPESFLANSSTPATHVPHFAFEGVGLDELFEYAPTGTEVGVLIALNGTVVEVFTVDFNQAAKDHNGKSTYVETVINNQSNYVFAKDNTANTDSVADHTLVYDEVAQAYVGNTLKLSYGADSAVGVDDIANAYDVFSNKEELDIDIVIGNEFDGGVSAKNLVDARQDCIAFLGANYGDTVGKKSADAVSALITWRNSGAVNYNNMFVVASGNYKYQYDRYNDKYRWVNLAGDIAGLRAQTSMNRASWWASAGLERGQIKNVTKLAFNPTQGQRDMLYKNGINPIVSFPGQGTVMWGQKTLLSKPSSFDRVNVRGLFNTMERALSKMAKYQIMEFNDNFTRNRIVSMVKPYLGSVQAGRGIQDFLVICDESNNTPDVISRNQLVVDIYIKPTYVAEFIQLRFTNAGTNSFAEVIGG